MAPAKAPWSLRLRCWQLLAVARLSPVDTSSRTVRSGISSGVAQWLACWAHNPKVRGSKPRSAIAFSGFKISATAWGAGNRTLESAPTRRSVDRNHAPLWHSGPHFNNNMAPAKAPWSLRLRCCQRLAARDCPHSGPHFSNNMAPAEAPWSLHLRCCQHFAARDCPPWTRHERRCAMSSAAEWRSG